MANFTIQGTGKTVNLTKNNFVTRGGEGDVYIIGDVVYKITTTKKMIPLGKMKELSRLKHQHIIIPQNTILKNSQPCGYTMRAVPNKPVSLAKILPKGYREREGITPKQILHLVKEMIESINFIHSQGDYLQVDGNELNYMLPKDLSTVYFIDVNSYQTPTYPANAIMLSIRDWSVQQTNGRWQWSKLSDAWSFAILSFYMFTAIHPFKGRHPSTANSKELMVDNMKGHKSVLDPKTTFPTGPIYYPFENVIPGGKGGVFWQWYTSMFIRGERHYIPGDFQGKLNIAFAPIITHVKSSDNIKITQLQQYGSDIMGYYENFGKSVVITKDQIYWENQTINTPKSKTSVGFTPQYNTPLAAYTHNNVLTIQDPHNNVVAPKINCLDIMSYCGTFYIQNQNNILELQFIETMDKIIPLVNPVVSIMSVATTMYNGVVIQNMFDTTIVSIFPQTKHHRQFQISELIKYKIIEAQYDNNVLMVLGIDRKSGNYDRLVFRFSHDWQIYDCRKIKDIFPSSLNFTVTDLGICVCINEEDKLEIFSNKINSQTVKIIENSSIKHDMKLCCTNAQVKFFYGHKLYSLTIK